MGPVSKAKGEGFFFFKQKTAYEIVSGDWSSDVCSSDLMTKIPAPMMAPIPSVTKLRGPRARLRLCSPDSLASFISVSIGFVANKGLPMQLLLSQSAYTFVSRYQFGS